MRKLKAKVSNKIAGYTGQITISGAKNSATRILAASLITESENTLHNFPTELVDVKHKVSALAGYGATVKLDKSQSSATIDPNTVNSCTLESYNYPIRTTYLLAAGLLKRFGQASIPYPGGCKIGKRGYDQHIKVWENLGCKVEEGSESINITASKKNFIPLDIRFDISTIGGTENALICASMICDESHIRDAYVSPEVEDLINYLRATGVKIDVFGNSYIRVVGSNKLKGVNYSIMPDRIEALTWLVFGAITGGNLLVRNVPHEVMKVPIIHLHEANIDIFRNLNDAYISPECIINNSIQPFELACGSHPGVISDMQPFYVLLALAANGTSRIHDYRYPERTGYLAELSKFCPGAIEWEKGKITVHGPVNFIPAQVQSTDLRGSMAVLMAAIIAGGNSTVDNVEMALRGYNNLEEKLKNLNVDIIITD